MCVFLKNIKFFLDIIDRSKFTHMVDMNWVFFKNHHTWGKITWAIERDFFRNFNVGIPQNHQFFKIKRKQPQIRTNEQYIWNGLSSRTPKIQFKVEIEKDVSFKGNLSTVSVGKSSSPATRSERLLSDWISKQNKMRPHSFLFFAWKYDEQEGN